jgi:hypothetical protein
MTEPARSPAGLRALLIGATVVASWLGMQAIHECGHVLTAWFTGGEVECVVLHPLTISRTDLRYNHRPLETAWGGPVFGVLAPLAIWGVAVWLRPGEAFLLRFWAGFCLIANGAYLAFGAQARVGDCGDLLRHGAAEWHLWLFGAAAMPLGFWLWNGQGRYFGLGPQAEPIRRSGVWCALSAAVAFTALGLVVGDRCGP